MKIVFNAELYNSYLPLVRRVAARLVPSAGVDDVVQETFIAVEKNLHTFDGRSLLSSWIAGVTRNQAGIWRRRELAMQQKKQAVLAEAPSYTAHPEYDPFLRDRLLRGLAKLPPSQHEILVRAAITGDSYIRLAPELNLVPTTAQMRLRAARRAMRHHLRAGIHG